MLDFAIVGAGPVGLFCAVALRHAGRSVTILERDPIARHETRTIGIHSASLECLDRLGLLGLFVERGVVIERGVMVGSRGVLGTIDLRRASRRHGFALSVEQPAFEALLEYVGRERGVAVERGAEVVGFEQGGESVGVRYVQDGEQRRLEARHLIGCDGRESRVRESLGIGVWRHRIRGCHMMADFPRTFGLGEDAWFFLADQGLVESFPLPGEQSRWIVEAPGWRDRVDLVELCELVWRRTGYEIDPGEGSRARVFVTPQALARRFHRGRVLLVGDAAHVLSPFGAQGMNLGWLDAFALAEVVGERWTSLGLERGAIARWSARRRRAACSALVQAGAITVGGRRSVAPRVRNAILRVGLAEVFGGVVSRRFSMRGLL